MSKRVKTVLDIWTPFDTGVKQNPIPKFSAITFAHDNNFYNIGDRTAPRHGHHVSQWQAFLAMIIIYNFEPVFSLLKLKQEQIGLDDSEYMSLLQTTSLLAKNLPVALETMKEAADSFIDQHEEYYQNDYVSGGEDDTMSIAKANIPDIASNYELPDFIENITELAAGLFVYTYLGGFEELTVQMHELFGLKLYKKPSDFYAFWISLLAYEQFPTDITPETKQQITKYLIENIPHRNHPALMIERPSKFYRGRIRINAKLFFGSDIGDSAVTKTIINQRPDYFQEHYRDIDYSEELGDDEHYNALLLIQKVDEITAEDKHDEDWVRRAIMVFNWAKNQVHHGGSLLEYGDMDASELDFLSDLGWSAFNIAKKLGLTEGLEVSDMDDILKPDEEDL